jgi:peptidoglycan/xylan/chitin deacetylase (PgdA/CDA1 family)
VTGPGLATLTLSFDTELGWGGIESGRWRQRQDQGTYDRARETIRTLLKEMDALEIPATWAVVGGLLERPGHHDLDHLPPPARLAAQTALREGDEATFHAPGLIEAILGARTSQELACHTYSHTRFTYPGVDEEFVRKDLSRFAAIFPEEAGPLKSLTFPNNEEAFLEQVAACGLMVYRGKSPSVAKNRAVHLLNSTLHGAPLSDISRVPAGLWRSDASMLFATRPRRPDTLPYVYRKASRGLETAVRTGGVLHVWTHPYNFALSWGLLRVFIAFLRLSARLRDRGRLQIQTMVGLGT